ncbi:hypothetical protein C8Q79DRAFT_666199 [Trametes meyenii]|nr:hypothetical protein C8Q79DRAFT_666199 [Trametes meyenii]
MNTLYLIDMLAPSSPMSDRSRSSNSSRSSSTSTIAPSQSGFTSISDPDATPAQHYSNNTRYLYSNAIPFPFTETDRRSGSAPEHPSKNEAVYHEFPSYPSSASLHAPRPINAPSPQHLAIRTQSLHSPPHTYPPQDLLVQSAEFHDGSLDANALFDMSALPTQYPYPTVRPNNAISSHIYSHLAQEQSLRTQARCEWGGCGAFLDDSSCAGVRRHLKECHFNGNPPAGKDPLTCQWGSSCRRDPMQWENVPKHIAECHLKSMARTCSRCGGTFARSDTLKRHIESGGCSRPLVT